MDLTVPRVIAHANETFNTVAIAYVMQKTPYVFPIVGGRKVEQLHDNLEALSIALTPEHIAYLESILPFDLGFPSNFIVSAQFSRLFWPRCGSLEL